MERSMSSRAVVALALLSLALGPPAFATTPAEAESGMVLGPRTKAPARAMTPKEKKAHKRQLKIERYLAMARYLELHEGNPKLARAEYLKVLKADRKHLGASLAVVRIDRAAGKAARAESRLKKLTRSHPKEIGVWMELGELREQRNDATGALAAYRQALALQNNHADAHHRVAMLLQKRYAAGDGAVKGELTRHLKAFLGHTAMRKGPRHAAARRLVAELEGGALAVVIHDADTAYDTAWGNARMNHINRYMAQARSGYEKCLELAPSNQYCHHKLGLVFASVKASQQYDLARAKQAFAKAPDVADAQVELAIIARKEGDDGAALAALERALAVDDGSQRAWLELGIARKLGGQDKEAIEALARAWRVDPRSSVAASALGELNLLDPEHPLVQSRLRAGVIQGDVFSSEKFKSAVLAFEQRFRGVDPTAPELPVLEEMLERLLRAGDIETKHRFRVQVLNSPIVNAFALPNGHMYFTKGFFEFMRKTFPDRPVDVDHAPMAHVLAHEVIHVLQEHTVRTQVFRQSVVDSERVPDPSVLVHLVRIHEIEADREGMVLAFMAGYPPRGGVEFMEARGRIKEIPPHLDHPTYDERIHYLEEYWSNDAKFAWLSFSFGLEKMDQATKVEASDLAQAERLYRGAVQDFTRFAQTLKPTKEVLNNLGIAYAKLGIYRLVGPTNPLHQWNTRFSVERDLAMKYASIREKTPAGGTRGAGAKDKPAIPRELHQAVRQFQLALRKDPDYDKAKLNLALCYLAMEKLEEAGRQLDKVRANEVDPADVALLRGIVSAETGEMEAAQKAFTEAARSEGTRAAATFNLARARQRAGQAGDAKAAYEAFLGMEPKGAWADAARAALDGM